MKNTLRLIVGYIIGIIIFLLLIPLGLYKLSRYDYLLVNKILIRSDIFRYIVSSLFLLIGAFFALWSNIYLLIIGKGGPTSAFGISISPRTKKLVTTGPYRYSRNPMVFGAFSLYISIVIYLNSIIGLSCLLVFLPVAIIYLKLSEEKRLLKDFGNEYIEYKKKVSMIFPIKYFKK